MKTNSVPDMCLLLAFLILKSKKIDFLRFNCCIIIYSKKKNQNKINLLG